jgi:CDGSH-type Zn-finger protein
MEARMDNDYKIFVKEKGSLKVSGGVPLVRRAPMMTEHGEPVDWDYVGTGEQEKIETGERYSLCRCGKSKEKPFCDSSHHEADIDFSLGAERSLTAERREEFQGEGILLADDTSLCSNAGFCGTRLIKIWKMMERSGDPEVRERILRMSANCPSGRLETYVDGELVEPEYTPSIAVVPNGPLWVRGGIPIEAFDGYVYEVRNRVALCRCGMSKNKPFCDGAHDEIGFKAE